MRPNFRQLANEQRWNLVYWGRRLRHRDALPALPAKDAALVARLKRDGAVITSLAELAIPGSAAMLAAGDELHQAIIGRIPADKGGFTIHATAGEIGQHPELIRWGLNERLLAIVENYSGLPAIYRGLTVRRDVAGGDMAETRLLHRDNEDSRILKIIIYLSDVDERGGPFEFIPRDLTPASWRLSFDGSRAADAEMERLVPRDRWVPCTGKRGTAIIADTCSIYHRGRVAESADRQTLFFCYNSALPMSPHYCGPLFDPGALVAACPDLSAAQRAAISPPYE